MEFMANQNHTYLHFLLEFWSKQNNWQQINVAGISTYAILNFSFMYISILGKETKVQTEKKGYLRMLKGIRTVTYVPV